MLWLLAETSVTDCVVACFIVTGLTIVGVTLFRNDSW